HARLLARTVADDEQVRAHRPEHLGDGFARAVTARDHRDHGADTEDDAEHREHGAHLVAPQRPEREPDRGEDTHAAEPSWGAVAATPPAEARTGSCVLSSTIRPSRSVITRRANAAMSDSWVTST